MSQTADEKLTAFIKTLLGTDYTYHDGGFTAHAVVSRSRYSSEFSKARNLLPDFLKTLVKQCPEEEIRDSQRSVKNAQIWKDFYKD
jgi:hypothetical protein